MRIRIAGSLICAVWLLTILQVSCSIDDPCGKKEEGWNYKGGACVCKEGWEYKGTACVKKAAAKPVTKPAADASSTTDQEGGDGESGKAALTGLGNACATDADCAGKDADYCAVNLLTKEGICTIKCADSADICPDTYTCCNLPSSMGGPTCLDEKNYKSAKGAGACLP
jgi:hypothetical protein